MKIRLASPTNCKVFEKAAAFARGKEARSRGVSKYELDFNRFVNDLALNKIFVDQPRSVKA